MSKVKKLLAAGLSAAMIMGMSVTSWAASGIKPSGDDDLTVTVNNVEEGATITAYQIIDAEYDENGFIGYKWVAGAKAGQLVAFTPTGAVEGLTDAYVTGLAANTTGLTADASLQASGDGKLEAGTWMLLVTGSDLNKVYNPMIVSVYYTESGSDNEMNSLPVDANSNWMLTTNGAYAKSSEIPVDKTLSNEDVDAEVGETVTFTIKTTIPSYSADSVAKFDVIDKIENGLEYVLPAGQTIIAPTVKNGITDVAAGNYVVTMIGTDSFKVSFKPEYVRSLAAAGTNREITITYEAKITEDAITEKAENDVQVDYDNGSSNDTEYAYTYGFSGKKVGEGEDADGLAGAEFTLYRTWTDANSDGKVGADELSNSFGTSTTTEAGEFKINFSGLDGDLTYYLTETKAPSGYSVNNTVYTITFVPNTDENGIVTNYDVKVDGTVVATVTYGEAMDVTNFVIENTKLSSLPSTGGIGTTIFTIGGCAIMIIAAGLFFASRRKESK